MLQRLLVDDGVNVVLDSWEGLISDMPENDCGAFAERPQYGRRAL